MVQQKTTLNDLVSFYKSLLEALDLKVDKEGRIFIATGDKERPLTINGLPVVLPTDENTRTAVEIVNGTPTPVKIIFNPLDEDAIKGENESLKKLRQIIELKLNGVFYQIGESLFNVLYNTNKEVNNIEIIRFATLLNKYKATGLKHPIDEKLITNWIKLYKEILTSNYDSHAYIKIFSKRGGKINNIKYNRINSLGFPFAENLFEIKPNKEKFLDLKLRTKDKHAYLSLFEFIFKVDIEQILDGFKFGSLNKIAPGFHVLMLVYNFVYEHMRGVIEALVNLDLEDRELEYMNLRPLPVDINNMGDFIDSLEHVIKRVPKEDNLKQNLNNTATLATNTTQIQKPRTNNSPWGMLKEKVQHTNGYSQTNELFHRPATRGPLGSFGSNTAPVYNGYNPAPRPLANSGQRSPFTNTFNPVANSMPMASNSFATPTRPMPYRKQNTPVDTQYQNPFLRGY